MIRALAAIGIVGLLAAYAVAVHYLNKARLQMDIRRAGAAMEDALAAERRVRLEERGLAQRIRIVLDMDAEGQTFLTTTQRAMLEDLAVALKREES